MKKFFALMLLAMMLLALPALAEENNRQPAKCGIEGHYADDGLEHKRPDACWVKGHYLCDGQNHQRATCRMGNHYLCDGKDHSPAVCGAERHFSCDPQKHEVAACGVVGHCVSDGKNHGQAACGIEGHTRCDGQRHCEADCHTAGHYVCDGAEHVRATCGVKGHKVCDGQEHAKAFCGQYGHCVSDGKNHEAAPCGFEGHFVCDGKNHGQAACGVEGHLACEPRAHLNKVQSKYCLATPQHKVCEGRAEHYCDPALGGCGDTYPCIHSNAHTACKMCGLLWCDHSLGSHETPCGDPNHRPCVTHLAGKVYVREWHELCYWCGEGLCKGGHGVGAGKCVMLCENCGEGRRYNQKHLLECGKHYSCSPDSLDHSACSESGCKKFVCDGHTHTNDEVSQ